MSEQLYSSSFEYVTQSLDLNQSKEIKNLIKNGPQTEATNNTLMDFYANRAEYFEFIKKIRESEDSKKNRQCLQKKDNLETSFNQFVIQYKCVKGELRIRTNNDKIIIVTYPKVRFNPKITETYKEYCFFQLIKYSNWTIKEISIINDKETAIRRFEEFLKNTTPEIIDIMK